MNQYRPQAILRSILFFSLLLSGIAFGKPWKSAEMITQQSFKYGAFEARIRGAEGSGMITAFFLYKNGSEWAGAQWQEQDFELFGKNGGFQTQVMTPGEPRTENVTNHTAATDIWDRYYTYRMEWTPTALSFYVDGKLVRRETDPVTYSKLLDPARAEPMNLRISLWAGDFGWSGAFDETMVPASVDVNWAQVSTYTPGTGPDGSDFTPLWKDDFNSIDYSRWYFANWTFEFAVNDYTPGGARTDNGYLQLKLTHWSEEGRQFTPSPIDDGLLMPPVDEPDPTEPTDPVVVPTGPVALPGTINASEPSRYFDLTIGNHGSPACFVGDLDAEPSIEGGCNVGWSAPGEWQEYDVTVTTPGEYEIIARVATALSGVYFRIDVDDLDVTGEHDVLPTDWQSLSDLEMGSVFLTAGTHRVRVVHLTDGLNFRSITFTQSGASVEPPAVVQSVSALPGTGRITLSWEGSALATSYQVSRGPVGGPYEAVAVTTTTTWTDLTAVPEQSYGYVVTAINTAGMSLPSAPVSATVPALLPVDAPTSLAATASEGRVALAWTAGGNNTSFRVYRSIDGLTFALLASPVAASFSDLAVVNGTGYVYRVTGMFEGRESAPSANVSATPMGVPPAAVGTPTASAGDAQVVLTWAAVPGATSYKILRGIGTGTPILQTTVPTTSWTNTGLVNGTAYTYTVVATNIWGEALPSASVSATPVAPVIPVGSVKAQYRAGTTGTTNGIRPLLRLVNTGSTAIPLSQLTIRYWYTNEGGRAQSYWCDWAQVGNTNIVATFGTVSPARTGADAYLQIGFRTSAGNLAPGGSTGEIQSRFSKSDWSNYNQANDASYNASFSSFSDWTKVTVYRNGVLVWGVEP